MKNETHDINEQLKELGLVELTWGNASIRDHSLVYIKSSGADLSKSCEDTISVVHLQTGDCQEGNNPSVDTKTHLEIYKGFDKAHSIIHTHSHFATTFAQAGSTIPCLGTTHADYFNGSIPVVPCLASWDDYEEDTGKSIVKYFKDHNIDPYEINACLVEKHGVFVWGTDWKSCLESAFVLEIVAKMAYDTIMIGTANKLPEHIREQHYYRKNGDKKYYGQ